jgi:antitoxin ParD1/3/4
MNVLLKPELKKFVDERISAGQYADASELVNEALEVLREQETFTPKHEAYLRRELRRGLEQLDRGQFSDFTAETVIADERAKLRSSARRTQKKGRR